MNLREEIKETIQGWWGDPDFIDSEVDDIVNLFERRIDSMIQSEEKQIYKMNDSRIKTLQDVKELLKL
jgi:hypothetical protein